MKKPIKLRISDGERFAQLGNMGEKVFGIQDLATLWNIQNRHTLHMTLMRYVKRGLLFRVWKGIYSIVDPKTLDPYFLGFKVLHTYAYLSCETVLFNAGVLNQRPTQITFVSSKEKKFFLLGNHYYARKMPNNILYDENGITQKDGFFTADAQRAKKDLSFFYPKKYYDANL